MIHMSPQNFYFVISFQNKKVAYADDIQTQEKEEENGKIESQAILYNSFIVFSRCRDESRQNSTYHHLPYSFPPRLSENIYRDTPKTIIHQRGKKKEEKKAKRVVKGIPERKALGRRLRLSKSPEPFQIQKPCKGF